MGCISSKSARSGSSSPSPVYDSSVVVRDHHRNNGGGVGLKKLESVSSHYKNVGYGPLEKIREEPEKERGKESEEESNAQSRNRDSGNSKPSKRAAFSIRFGRLTEGEQVAAVWPAWLSAVAGEAIDGWLPLRSDNFERLEKIGQGTYSSVYRARNLQNGRMMALKKVRFDNFHPESVRFMAREITILRRLDHPNVMKLEGIITSRLSCSIYFVFEYMEHDLSGLLSCPDIKFSDSQIKCYMQQLLKGIEHCHSRGILHRDIKASNILVNNEGVLKIADFGLANFLNTRNRQPLTSRVVTLWYRPPELLLGSTSYGASVDMWSVGCVFAELFIGRPILKGRTEVEQLHKIFKLCGSPPDEYWKASRLPLAAMFKPQQASESTLRERCKELPKSAVNLLETFLSIEPYRRGTAASALESEYFTTKPYACKPSSLPKYPPNKEIDAKFREEARRKKVGGGGGGRVRVSGASRNPRRLRRNLQEPDAPTEEMDMIIQAHRSNGGSGYYSRANGATMRGSGSSKQSYDTMSEASQATEASQASQADTVRTVPIQLTGSSSFVWAKRRPDVSFARVTPMSRNESFNMNSFSEEQETPDSRWQESDDFATGAPRSHDEITKHRIQRDRSLRRPGSFDSADIYEAQESAFDYHDQEQRIQFSGPVVMQSHTTDGRQESLTRPARRSRFYRDL